MNPAPWSLVDPDAQICDIAPCGLVVFDEKRHHLVAVKRKRNCGFIVEEVSSVKLGELGKLNGSEKIGDLVKRWGVFHDPRFLLVPGFVTPQLSYALWGALVLVCAVLTVVLTLALESWWIAPIGVFVTLFVPLSVSVIRTSPRIVGQQRLGVDPSNVHAYALAVARGELWRGALPAASVVDPTVQVQRIREEYGRLCSDLLFRLESPALFDPAVPTTAAFEAALVDFENTPTAEVAARVEVRFEVARQHAVRAGLRHVEPQLRDEVARAGKIARLALNAGSQGEREAALAQLQRMLDSLALYYLPSRTDVAAIER
ncbi:hypothetical protein [Tessaracoccus sp. OH4464_COT-324]|uniref:hypothetical protein n=1 Tax=Tessaracoccus sp. OH4464_COT-324 TaxID=2491059 RepID=UPI000F62ED9C|nr:hypothetical protein [Tessaracoccus sp. OH4464_COT-324]RRD47318.1 hypothetical protein EII42_03410 [Tessaracoccus sp. OH4464_COT-324]